MRLLHWRKSLQIIFFKSTQHYLSGHPYVCYWQRGNASCSLCQWTNKMIQLNWIELHAWDTIVDREYRHKISPLLPNSIIMPSNYSQFWNNKMQKLQQFHCFPEVPINQCTHRKASYSWFTIGPPWTTPTNSTELVIRITTDVGDNTEIILSYGYSNDQRVRPPRVY